MRDNPRYSIMPAGAVLDPRLEGRDLQVLALLGSHTDKLGWVEASSQSALAVMIRCSRQTFQRSIARLVAAGWVQAKTKFVSESGRPYAPYAYRVMMDRDDPEIPPAESEVAAGIDGEGAHRRAPLLTGEQGVPIQAGQGCPRIHGHQESRPVRDQKDSDSVARDGHSVVAAEIAEEIAAIAGVDPAKNSGWFIVGPALIIQRWMDAGYLRWHLIEGARRGMAKRGKPPDDIRYFGKLWQRVRGEAETPAPPAEVITTSQQRTGTNGRPGDRSLKGALGKLDDRIREIESGMHEGGQVVAGLLPDRRCERS